MMNHVHWGLFATSFVAGVMFTLALMVRPVRSQVPAGASARESDADVESATTSEIPAAAKEAPTAEIPVAEAAPPAKPPVAEEKPTTKIPFAPYGKGSARADADGGGPAGWPVKGRSDTRLYYTPEDAAYEQITAQVWFTDEESAASAYFTAWRNSKRK